MPCRPAGRPIVREDDAENRIHVPPSRIRARLSARSHGAAPLPAVARVWPSGEIAIDSIVALSTENQDRLRPVVASQTITPPPRPQETNCLPSGVKSAPRTLSRCPVKVNRNAPVAASQTLTL